MSKSSVEFITLADPGITDFAAARNALIKKSKADWVFFVDSDEKVPDQLRKEIDTRTQNTNFNGFYVYRKNYFLGNYVGTDNILRLGRTNSGQWKRRVHEVWHIKGTIGQLENPLIHETANNLHDFIGKLNFYSTLHAKEKLNEGDRSSLFKIICYPVGKFWQSIITGRGFVMSMLQSFHSFLGWSKLWLLQNA